MRFRVSAEIGTPESSVIITNLSIKEQLAKAGNEGFVILSTKSNQKNITAIAESARLELAPTMPANGPVCL